ncbi:MAG: hypothetical protein KKI02_08450 [Planctomycetes bacterium]|nr:hypothetical protein [Planctomycetota bacterium]
MPVRHILRERTRRVLGYLVRGVVALGLIGWASAGAERPQVALDSDGGMPAVRHAEGEPSGLLATFVAEGRQPVPMQVTLSETGGIQLSVAGHEMAIVTRTSLPGGQWQESGCEPSGIQIPKGNSAIVSWRTVTCRIDRQVTVFDDHVYVADTFTNLGDTLVGVMVEHRLTSPPSPTVLLAGRRNRTGARNCFHPSVFAFWQGFGVGIVAEDDIFRVHNLAFNDARGVGLADDQLGVAPHAAHTLEWSIYPVPGGDYWDFVNAVRRNWGANITIPGPFMFVMYFRNRNSSQWYADWVRRRGGRILSTGVAKNHEGRSAYGTGIHTVPTWVTMTKAWMAKLHAAMPDVRTQVYFHAQLSTEPGAESIYAADRLLDARGRQVRYPPRREVGLYVPTRENKYGRALWDYVRISLDTIGADGLYWDEMSYSVEPFAYQAPWDSCTVIIDRKTHTVRGKRSSVALLMQPFKLDIVRYLHSRGKLLIANWQAPTRTMLRENIVRFVETQRYTKVIDTHFGCPLGLANHHREESQADAARSVRGILEFGGLYCVHSYQRQPAAWNFTDLMYPTTPVEIGPHVLLAEERILTARSGRFGWSDGAEADVYLVDQNGNRVGAPNVSKLQEDGRWLYEIRMPPEHFAILVKKARAR